MRAHYEMDRPDEHRRSCCNAYDKSGWYACPESTMLWEAPECSLQPDIFDSDDEGARCALENSRYALEIDAEGTWLSELKTCIQSMRSWAPPDPSSIRSPIGTSIRSSQVPGHAMGPFASGREFYDYLFSPASSHAFETPAEYEQTWLCAKKLQ